MTAVRNCFLLAELQTFAPAAPSIEKWCNYNTTTVWSRQLSTMESASNLECCQVDDAVHLNLTVCQREASVLHDPMTHVVGYTRDICMYPAL